MSSRFLVLLVIASVVVSPWLTPVSASASDPPVYISAVQITGGTGHTKDDFVELFNPGSTAVSLSGYSLIKRTATSQTNTSLVSFSATSSIGPRSFILWANNEFAAISAVPDFTSTGIVSDDNGVALLKAGAIIDSVTWGTTSNGLHGSGLANPTANQSIVRSNLYSSDGSYALAASHPRNSTVTDPGPVLPPPLVDNAACTAPASFTVGPSGALTVPLTVQNTGTTTWATEYALGTVTTPPGLLWDGASVPVTASVPPGQSTTIIITGLAPETVGDYSATWQMSRAGSSFGDICTIQFTVSAPLPPDDPIPPPVDPPPVTPPVPTLPPVAPPVTPPVNYSHQLRLAEVLPNPTGSDPGHEAVEIYNAGTTAVSLTNWRISDGTVEDGPASNGYVLTNQQVEPGGYVVITVPSGRFSMNNSSGDTITLYDPTAYAVDSVAYPGPAPEGQSYQLAGEQWLWAEPSLGLENIIIQSLGTIDLPTLPPIEISEIGQTSKDGITGWFIELHNTSNQAVNLSGVSLVVNSASGEPVRMLTPSQTINSKAYVAVAITNEDVIAAFTLGVTARLQTAASSVIDTVTLEQLPNLTYSWGKTTTGKWQLGRPTPGTQNYFVIAPPVIKLSEVYPYPASGEEEFVEIYNSGEEPFSLSSLTLGVDKSETRLPAGQIFPGEFFVVAGDDLPKGLPNKNAAIWLKDQFGSIIDQISYTKTTKGQSLVRTSDKNLIWTKDITPGEAYGRVLGLASDTEVVTAPEPSSEITTTTKAASGSKTVKTSSSSQTTLQKKVVALEAQLAQAAQALAGEPVLAAADGQGATEESQSNQNTPPESNDQPKPATRWWVWAVLAAAMAICAAIAYVISRSEN